MTTAGAADSPRAAEDFFARHLAENLVQADTLHRMRDVVREFRARAPCLVSTKCIDGRVHGSKAKGYPPTVPRFGRTDGNNVDLRPSNFWFWNRIDRAVVDAERNTPDTPALFIALMHRSDAGLGCAAHGGDDSKAHAAVEAQVAAVRKVYGREKLYPIIGVTNTDTMAERLELEGGVVIDPGALSKQLGLGAPSDVFSGLFLSKRVDDPATDRHLGGRTPGELLSGGRSKVFHDLRVGLSLEAYLLRELTTRLAQSPGRLYEIVASPLVDRVLGLLERVTELPPSLRAPLLYMMVWNTACSLSQTNLVAQMGEAERLREIDHAEELVCYGEGFELMARNKAILVKTGRGDDVEALLVARRVLEKIRSKHPQPFWPLVHVNIELSSRPAEWEGWVDEVASRLMTMVRNVRMVFGDEAHLLTSYSYTLQKLFFPVHPGRGEHTPCQLDVSRGLDDRESFSGALPHAREMAYASGER